MLASARHFAVRRYFVLDRSEIGAAPPRGSFDATGDGAVSIAGSLRGFRQDLYLLVAGICDRRIQPRIDAALDGTADIVEVVDAVEPRLWEMAMVLPIMQDTTIVAAGPSVQGVNPSGALPVGIVGDAGKWTERPQQSFQWLDGGNRAGRQRVHACLCATTGCEDELSCVRSLENSAAPPPWVY